LPSFLAFVFVSHNRLTHFDAREASNDARDWKPGFPRLRRLWLDHNAIQQLNLSGLPKVEEMYLSDNRVSDPTIPFLLTMCSSSSPRHDISSSL
jgi:hypothetical protein